MIAQNNQANYKPVVLSVIALVTELVLLPTVRALPEYPSFWALWLMLALVVICATAGMLSGAKAFRERRAGWGLAGFLTGSLTLILLVVSLFRM